MVYLPTRQVNIRLISTTTKRIRKNYMYEYYVRTVVVSPMLVSYTFMQYYPTL